MSGNRSNRIVPEVGIHYNVPFREYLAWDAMSQSILREILNSPLDFLWRLKNPPEITREMILGNALDNYVYDRRFFNNNYWITKKVSTRDRKYKELVRKYGKEFVIFMSELHACEVLVKRIRQHKLASKLFTDESRVQMCLVWRDEETGLLCKGRPDMFTPGLKAFFDLKSASRNTHPRKWGPHLLSCGYHFQAAWYLWLGRSLGLELDGFNHLVYETVPPHKLTNYPLTKEMLELGEDERVEALRRYKKCVDEKCFHGYEEDGLVAALQNPGWLKSRQPKDLSNLIFMDGI